VLRLGTKKGRPLAASTVDGGLMGQLGLKLYTLIRTLDSLFKLPIQFSTFIIYHLIRRNFDFKFPFSYNSRPFA